MNQLTLLYVNQADREREVTQEVRDRQLLEAAGRIDEDPARANQRTDPHPASRPDRNSTPTNHPQISARAAGR